MPEILLPRLKIGKAFSYNLFIVLLYHELNQKDDISDALKCGEELLALDPA